MLLELHIDCPFSSAGVCPVTLVLVAVVVDDYFHPVFDLIQVLSLLLQ